MIYGEKEWEVYIPRTKEQEVTDMQENRIKSGVHALYQGKEYSASYDPIHKEVELLTCDQNEAANGFLPAWKGRLEKTVGLDQIESLYHYVVYAVYGGVGVLAHIADNGKVILRDTGMGNSDDLLMLGFVQVDRDEFRKEVAMEELDQIGSTKLPMLHFKLPEDLA
ncbi:hypothetical protein OS242_20085 [Tumebacillus sp. DT12]|uniref:Uncharacterized protein n=1 Tax=Tumebacillus lacus TaxID=2995335 RepID=A0ABT3X976_9BACL|nr:hypothetical protein [Tumebacillus lacus]MCX7572211.1 hypothetical protein [Tumebacillus lacus]